MGSAQGLGPARVASAVQPALPGQIRQVHSSVDVVGPPGLGMLLLLMMSCGRAHSLIRENAHGRLGSVLGGDAGLPR